MNKDITEKKLEDHNDVFCDIVNVLLFNGARIIREDELEDYMPSSQYKAEDGFLHEEERDVAKRWKKCNIKIASFGIENQSSYYKYMPVRIIGYDGANYREQLLDKGMKRIYPVVSMVLNFSMKRWNRNICLYDVLDIREELKPYVNDYKINVFDIAFLSDKQIEMFQSDFKVVAKYFADRRKRRKFSFPENIPEHVDEVLKMLSVLTGDVRFTEGWNSELSKVNKEGFTMGEKWIDDIEERGVKRGREEGIKEGIKEGHTAAEEEMKRAVELKSKGITDIKEYLSAGISQTIASLILGIQTTSN